MEQMQYHYALGVTELDDILCNTTGAALGYGIAFAYVMISRMIKKGKTDTGKEQTDEHPANA